MGGGGGEGERGGWIFHESWILSMGRVSLCYSINPTQARPSASAQGALGLCICSDLQSAPSAPSSWTGDGKPRAIAFVRCRARAFAGAETFECRPSSITFVLFVWFPFFRPPKNILPNRCFRLFSKRLLPRRRHRRPRRGKRPRPARRPPRPASRRPPRRPRHLPRRPNFPTLRPRRPGNFPPLRPRRPPRCPPFRSMMTLTVRCCPAPSGANPPPGTAPPGTTPPGAPNPPGTTPLTKFSPGRGISPPGVFWNGKGNGFGWATGIVPIKGRRRVVVAVVVVVVVVVAVDPRPWNGPQLPHGSSPPPPPENAAVGGHPRHGSFWCLEDLLRRARGRGRRPLPLPLLMGHTEFPSIDICTGCGCPCRSPRDNDTSIFPGGGRKDEEELGKSSLERALECNEPRGLLPRGEDQPPQSWGGPALLPRDGLFEKITSKSGP